MAAPGCPPAAAASPSPAPSGRPAGFRRPGPAPPAPPPPPPAPGSAAAALGQPRGQPACRGRRRGPARPGPPTAAEAGTGRPARRGSSSFPWESQVLGSLFKCFSSEAQSQGLELQETHPIPRGLEKNLMSW